MSVSVDPPHVLLHVAGGDQSPAVLAHFLPLNIGLRSVRGLAVLQVQRLTVETFFTLKAGIFLFFPRLSRSRFGNMRGVFFIQLHIILQEIINSEDCLLFARAGYL